MTKDDQTKGSGDGQQTKGGGHPDDRLGSN